MQNSLKHQVAEERGDFQEKQLEVAVKDDGLFDWGDEWDQVPLLMAQLSANMVPSVSTTHSPFFELTGRQPVLDPNQFLPEHEEDDDFYDPKFTSITKESVEDKIEKLQRFRAHCKV